MPLETSFTAVDPVHPVAAYIGGKRRLAERLVKAIAEVPHVLYAEPFVGMGGVFFRRRSRPRSEVINDRNGEFANLFRILQRHYPQFMDTLRFQLTGRREFDRLKVSDPATLTDLERAGRFLYLQRLAFGGKVRGQSCKYFSNRIFSISVSILLSLNKFFNRRADASAGPALSSTT